MSDCPGVSRRTFLSDVGMGVTGMALGARLSDARATSAPPRPRADSVIWIFLCGGVSQMESFDPKPALLKYEGKTMAQTPFAEVLDPKKNPFAVQLERSAEKKPLLRMQTGFQKRGRCGMDVSDVFPEIGGHADDIAVVRSLWTTSALHIAQLQFHTGRAARDGGLPTVGSWAVYGLGSLNENLPEYVVLGKPSDTCCGGNLVHGAGYLGAQHAGVRLHPERKDPLPYLAPEVGDVKPEALAAKLRTLAKLHRLAAVEYPDDPALTARIRSYELAARMQTSVPESLDLKSESKETEKLYGLDQDNTRPFGTLCLAARRLAERGVRFIQVFHQTSGFGPWDAHRTFIKEHAQPASQVDQPIAGLLTDLKRRGLLSRTLVVCATEFGRTPTTAMTQDGKKGREHNPFGFSSWLAGGGIKGGTVHGATDELGYHAVEDRHYVTDLHATVLHQLGLDSKKLDLPGRRRLDVDHGVPIAQIIA